MSKAAELAALIGSGQAQGDRNLIINGAMTVSQRGTSFADLSGYGLDRFQVGSSDSAAVTVTQDTTVPSGEGFKNSMKFDVTTADTSLGASEYYQFFQKIEGQNMAHLMWGTSDAKSVTLSFWCRSNKTGIYPVTFLNNATNRFNPNNFTISSANTWEKKTITVSGDTTGTWLTTNGIGMYVIWNLALGSNFDDGTNGTWGTGDYSSGGNVNFLDSTSNEFYLTGIQLEEGDVATAFEHEDFGTTLAKCQRYYYRIGGAGTYHRYAVGSCQGTNSCGTVIYSPAGEMRDTPTLETTGTAGNYAIYEADGVNACSSIPAINSVGTNSNHFSVTFTSSGNLASGNAAEVLANNNANAFLAFKSEL